MPEVIARPMHQQTQSPLLSLPPEIRNQLYTLVFPTSEIILNPGTKVTTDKSISQRKIPQINLSLFSTCRLAYAEADLRILYSKNRFGFTQADHAKNFFAPLPPTHRVLITDVELDLREINDKIPSIAKDWAKYMFWSNSGWTEHFAGLRTDAPGLRTLRINLDSWPLIATKRSNLWVTLRRMLYFVRGIERVTVTGASRGPGMEKFDPWLPMHYVGSDGVGEEDLVPLMSAAIGKDVDDEEKIIVWTRTAGTITVEVCSLSYVRVERRQLPPSADADMLQQILPRFGWCTLARHAERIEMKDALRNR